MNTEREIADYIIQLLRQHGTLLGAALGAHVKSRFPDFNIRVYRNLRTFISLHCGDLVQPVTRHGLDYCWGLRQQSDVAAPTTTTPVGVSAPANGVEAVKSVLPPVTSSPPSFALKKNSPWQAFINPTAAETLQVNLENAEIRIDSSGNPPSKPWVEVAKITTAEHRAIAAAFIPQLDPADQPRFKVILGNEDFWNKWSYEMKTEPYRKYSQTWVDFRFYKLCDFFRQRLTGLGAGEAIIDSSLANLKESKSRERLKAGPKTSSVAGSIRETVLRAIEELSEDELRRLWLPVGVVHDALRKS